MQKITIFFWNMQVWVGWCDNDWIIQKYMPNKYPCAGEAKDEFEKIGYKSLGIHNLGFIPIKCYRMEKKWD